jgi:AsmA protein
MAITPKNIIKRTLKFTGITLLSVLLLMFLIPYLFPGPINRKIDEWANQNINGHITFSRTRLSFFKHFPALSLSLYDVTLKGSAPFENDTLIAAKQITLGIDVPSVFKSKIKINKIYLNQAYFNIQTDSLGRANYNIYKPSAQKATATTDTNGGASLGISRIEIDNSRLVYNDQSLPMTINARGFKYMGSGDLTKDVFDLNTHCEIQSLDFYFSKQAYVLNKKINADLVTQIDTKSLTFVFQKNDLMINQLPVEFIGRFGFIKDGYEMSFNIDSHEKDIDEIVTALPPDYQKMLEKTEINGTGEIQMTLAGKYVAKDSIAPNLSMSCKIRNGYIANDKSPSPIKNLYLDFTAALPGLNPDSMAVNIDSLYFNIADGYLSSVVKVKGLKVPDVYARVNSEIDLEKWDNAIGLKPFHVKGKYKMHMLAEGKYATKVTEGPKHKMDTVITSIPKFTLQSSFRGGYFKYSKLPEAISNISFNMQAECTDNDYKHITLSVDSLNVTSLNNYLKGSFKLTDLSKYTIDAALQANIHLEDLKKMYPIDSLEMKGDLVADIKAKGNYLPAKKQYPLVDGQITMHHGYIQTKYYPHPIQDIEINTTLVDKTGDLKGLNVSIQPITFSLENEPFSINADLKDFTNLDYKIKAQGILDLGKIYQVFAIKGYNVTGIITANLNMKGRQADATAGHYDKLFNKGYFKIKDVTATMDIYPKPFYIPRGVFSFKQDKMQLDTLIAKYGSSVFVLNGTVSNVIDYIMKPGSVLKGNFDLSSDQIVADDFMLVTDTTKTVAKATPATPAPASTPATTSVIIVPSNLDLTFTANVKKLKYTDILLTDAKGNLTISHGVLAFKETGFTIIDAPVTMEGDYTSITTKKAKFNYHIVANNFDIHKAYTKIKLFHDMATSASSAEGLISLDYKLGGNLNAGMTPIYPSLKGGGVLTAEKIKMKGFKLFSSIGKETGKDSLGSNSDVSKVNLKTTIANNIITIEQTKMKVAVFRAKFGGQVSFNNELNLKFRLGLPPMGIIGIPMTITGTEDKPKISLGKGKKEDELQETADNDD